MNTINQAKVPVFKILVGSILTAWWNKEEYSKALALPTLLLVSIWAMDVMVFAKVSGPPRLVFTICYIISFSIYCVTCHRLILLKNGVSGFRLSLNIRELKFTGWLVVVYLIYFIVLYTPLTVIMNIPNESEQIKVTTIPLFGDFMASIPAMYFLARICLVLPATAIDKDTRLKWSWKITRGNGWRIAIIVGIYPLLISSLLWLITRHDETVIEYVIIGIFYYIGLALEIFALSLTYKEIVRTSSNSYI